MRRLSVSSLGSVEKCDHSLDILSTESFLKVILAYIFREMINFRMQHKKNGCIFFENLETIIIIYRVIVSVDDKNIRLFVKFNSMTVMEYQPCRLEEGFSIKMLQDDFDPFRRIRAVPVGKFFCVSMLPDFGRKAGETEKVHDG